MRVLFISASKFDSLSAEASRINFLSQLFSFDNEVRILCRGSKNVNSLEKIEIFNLSNQLLIQSNKLARLVDYVLFHQKVKKYLINNKDTIDAIVFCALSTTTLRFILKYSKKYNKILIHDAVEWYSAEQFKYGALNRLYIKKELWMRHLLPGNCRIIAISRYLQDYFSLLGNKCVYIPSILEVNEMKVKEIKSSDKITIVYAGIPHKKDYLGIALEGIAMLDNNYLSRIEIKIMGITKNQAKENYISFETINKLGDSLIFLGLVPRNIVFSELKKADFSILLRPDYQRYSKAGFPTKVPESMSVGTAVICNFTSDLKDFLIDGKNCIEVRDCSAIEMHRSMQRILELSRTEINNISKEAIITSLKSFDFRNYKKEVSEILE